MTSSDFWERWFRADELERFALVRTLALPAKISDEALYEHHCATLINSYLCDLEEYLQDYWAEFHDARLNE